MQQTSQRKEVQEEGRPSIVLVFVCVCVCVLLFVDISLSTEKHALIF